MLQTFPVSYNNVEDHLYPNFYKFKLKLKEFFERPDILSFRLGDKGVVQTLTDGEHAGQVFVEKGALFIKNSSVKRYYIDENDGFYISHEKNNLLKRSQLENRDVLFTTIGKYLGVASIVNENLVGANINQNVVRLRIDEKFVSHEYLAFYLNSKFARFQIDNLFTGNTHPILTYPKLKSIAVFLKSREIERLITANAVEIQKLELDSHRLLKKAQHLFLTKLDIDFSAIKDRKTFSLSFADFEKAEVMSPENYRPLFIETIEKIKQKVPWDLLGNLATFLNGDEVGSENYNLYLDSRDTHLPFIRTTDLCNYSLDRYPDFYIDNAIAEDIAQIKVPNEILFTKDGKIGQLAFRTDSDNAIIGSGILRIVAKNVDPYYLFLALSINEIGQYQAQQRTVIASTMPHLREDRVADFVIPLLDDTTEMISLVKTAFNLKEKGKILTSESRRIIDESLPLDL
ncbi:MAG TPA: hypothetical protein VIQ77_07320 [Mucilaginibacter sp.]